MPDNLDRLQELAEALPHSAPWTALPFHPGRGHSITWPDGTPIAQAHISANPEEQYPPELVAEFIAAANPQTILNLIQRIRTLENEQSGNLPCAEVVPAVVGEEVPLGEQLNRFSVKASVAFEKHSERIALSPRESPGGVSLGFQGTPYLKASLMPVAAMQSYFECGFSNQEIHELLDGMPLEDIEAARKFITALL